MGVLSARGFWFARGFGVCRVVMVVGQQGVGRGTVRVICGVGVTIFTFLHIFE